MSTVDFLEGLRLAIEGAGNGPNGISDKASLGVWRLFAEIFSVALVLD